MRNQEGHIFFYEDDVKLYLISGLLTEGRLTYVTQHKEEAELFTRGERIALYVLLKLRGVKIKLYLEPNG